MQSSLVPAPGGYAKALAINGWSSRFVAVVPTDFVFPVGLRMDQAWRPQVAGGKEEGGPGIGLYRLKKLFPMGEII